MANKKTGDGRGSLTKRPRLHASHADGSTDTKPGRSRPARGTAKPARGGQGAAKKSSAKSSAKPAPPGRRATGDPEIADSARKPLGAPSRRAPRRSTPPAAEASDEVRQLAILVAAAGIEKKALGVEVLDVTGKVDYADFLVIMTGRSDRHVQAIAAGIEDSLRKKKIRPLSMEGTSLATWVLIDFGDVVVHVFQEEARRVYDIEGLWIDADRLTVPGTADSSPHRAGIPPYDA